MVELVKGSVYKIVANDAAHEFEIGELVVCINDTPGDRQCRSLMSGARWWVHPADVELFQKEEVEVSKVSKVEFKIGDKVRVQLPEGKKPVHGWGPYVENGDVGTVAYISERLVSVDFPKHKNWNAIPQELQLLSEEVKQFQVTEVKLPRNKVYAVVHKDTPTDLFHLTFSREDARETKSACGGKAKGFLILQFGAEKEIR